VHGHAGHVRYVDIYRPARLDPALAISLTPAELARIEEAVPATAVVGARYQEHLMQHLDSER
jgi:hypothetical protein